MLLKMTIMAFLFSPCSAAIQTANEAVRKLSANEIVSGEDAPVGEKVNRGVAARYDPLKWVILNDWRLIASRPGGEPVPTSDVTKQAILDEVLTYLGEGIIDDKIVPFMETYADLIPKSRRDREEKSGENLEDPRVGIIYFIPFQKGVYHVHVLGELGSFISVFIKLPGPEPVSVDLCKELFPRIDISQMDRNEDHSRLEAGGVQLRTGRRITFENVPFYGLRLDVELTKLIASVGIYGFVQQNLKGVFGDGLAAVPIDQLDAPDRWRERTESVVGEQASAIRMDRWRIGQELSIAPETNFKRRGASAALLWKNSYKTLGTLQLGILATPSDAVHIFQEHLEYASVRPEETDDGRPGQRHAGWWNDEYKGFDRIVFVRDNAVVDLHLFLDRAGKFSDPNSVTLNCAKRIDAALAFGRYGVMRANEIKLPRIVSVELPVEAGLGTKVEAKVHIISPEGGKGGWYSAEKEVEITQTIPFLVPPVDPNDPLKGEATIPYEVVYVTSGCAIASQEVALKINPAMAAKPKAAPDPEQEKRRKEFLERFRQRGRVPQNDN